MCAGVQPKRCVLARSVTIWLAIKALAHKVHGAQSW
jgi:hypothetical protein